MPRGVVLPTRVGMVREIAAASPAKPGSPHPRGDGPSIGLDPDQLGRFSPPAWGWSAILPGRLGSDCVLPTRVGMVRGRSLPQARAPGSPPPRGDGPCYAFVTAVLSVFSPPAWGWSVLRPQHCAGSEVLPTRVGMVRQRRSLRLFPPGSPHPRGDGPLGCTVQHVLDLFSPPAWGWSVSQVVTEALKPVLPTRVGMVRAGQLARCPL